MKYVVLHLFLILTCASMAQTGPGGIGNSTSNVLWLRAEDIGQADNTAVTLWNDQSGNTNHANQSNASYQPTFQTNEINGFPVVRFDGVDDYFDDNRTYNARSIICVYNVSSTAQANTDLAQIWGSYSEGVHVALDARDSPGTWSFDGSPGLNSGVTGAVSLNGSALSGFSASLNSNNWGYDQFQIGAIELNNTTGITRQVIGSLVPGFTVGTHQYGGDIAELIVFNTQLNTAERLILINHLAAKYNLSISNDLFNYESTHSHDVSGIGQSSTGNNHTTTESGDIFTLQGASSLSNGDYLLVGHDNGDATTWVSTESPDGGTYIEHLAREWRVTETGDVGTVDILIETAGFNAQPLAHNLYGLMVDDDGDFSSGATVYEMTLSSGTEYIAQNVEIADGQFIAIASLEGTVGHSLASSFVNESDVATIEVSLNYIPQTDVTVSFSTSDGTATTADADYTAANSSVTITAPAQTASYTITTLDDVAQESIEDLTITLSSPSRGSIGVNPTHTLNIQDNDNPRKIYFDAASSSISESVTSGSISVSINLVDASNPTTVDYTVTGGTATGGGTDYTLSAGTLTIPANSTSASINFTVVNDGEVEPDETIIVTLSNPSNADLDVNPTPSGTGFIEHTYTIANDDAFPEIQFSSVSASFAESAGVVSINLELNTTGLDDASVDYAVSSGTATGGGVDYTLASGTATITASNTSTSFNVTLADDFIEEPTETVVISLSSPTNATLGANTSFTLSITDDDDIGFVGPGGIGQSARLQLWMIADSVSGAEGSDVASWSDESGNGRTAIQNSATERPSLRLNFVNGHNAIEFDGTGEHLSNVSSYEGRTVFAVFRMESTSQSNNDLAQLWGSYGEGAQIGPDARNNGWSFDGGGSSQARVGINGAAYSGFFENSATPSWSYNSFMFAKFEFNSNKAVTRNDIGSLISPSGHYLGGQIAELIVFDIELNTAQTLIIENYLSGKYNIATTGNDIYVYDSPGSFEHEIAGIGRVNSTNLHDDSKGTGKLRVLNPQDLSDDEYFVFGHNNGLYATDNFIDIPAGMDSRFGREWRVSEVNSAGTAVDVGAIDLYFDLSGLGPITASELNLLLDTDFDGLYADETPISGASLISGSTYAFSNVTGITDGMRFTLGSSDTSSTPLPVSLLTFNARRLNYSEVELNWKTASEINCAVFEVQRSTDSQHWEVLGSLPCKGDNQRGSNYNWLDSEASADRLYYRLKQIDVNGDFEFFKSLFVNQISKSVSKVVLSPNPATNELFISCEEGLTTPKLRNIYGVELHVPITYNGSNTIKLNISTLSAGIYLVQVNGEAYKFTKQ